MGSVKSKLFSRKYRGSSVEIPDHSALSRGEEEKVIEEVENCLNAQENNLKEFISHPTLEGYFNIFSYCLESLSNQGSFKALEKAIQECVTLDKHLKYCVENAFICKFYPDRVKEATKIRFRFWDLLDETLTSLNKIKYQEIRKGKYAIEESLKELNKSSPHLKKINNCLLQFNQWIQHAVLTDLQIKWKNFVSDATAEGTEWKKIEPDIQTFLKNARIETFKTIGIFAFFGSIIIAGGIVAACLCPLSVLIWVPLGIRTVHLVATVFPLLFLSTGGAATYYLYRDVKLEKAVQKIYDHHQKVYQLLKDAVDNGTVIQGMLKAMQHKMEELPEENMTDYLCGEYQDHQFLKKELKRIQDIVTKYEENLTETQQFIQKIQESSTKKN